MTVVLDTGVVVALIDRDDAHHEAVHEWMQVLDDDLVTTPLALAEMDHFAASVGVRAPFWADLERGAYGVRWWADALVESLRIAGERPDVGLTDASLVALARRSRTRLIATLDHRHFRTLTDVDGEPYVLLPADRI